MKIVNEYLIIGPISGEVQKYIEVEDETFFKESDGKYSWIPSQLFYEIYDKSKKQIEEWKRAIN